MAAMKRAIGVYVIALAACGPRKPAPRATVNTLSNHATASAPTVTWVELGFYEDALLVLTLSSNGHIAVCNDLGDSVVCKDAGSFGLDGTVTLHHDLLGKLTPEGLLEYTTSSSSVMHPAVWLSDDALSIGDRKLTIDPKGGVQGTSRRIRVDGITDAGSKRTALLLLATTILRSEIISQRW
jgi:hypothetical protein